MLQPKVPLSSPHMGGLEEEFIKEAFQTNWIAPLGPHVNNFENDLQEYNQIDHVAALSSGTAAIHLSLILNDVGPGDLVFVQSLTFSATVNPIVYQGAVPVLIDSEPDTWNMSPLYLKLAVQALRKGSLKFNFESPKLSNITSSPLNFQPKCIIPVHLYGMPVNIDAIMEIGREYDLPIIEDAAHSLGSTYRGKPVGSIGQMGVFSFNGNKIISTGGGGALVANDGELIAMARKLAAQARDEAPHYNHSNIGYNYRLSNVLAGIGRGQMQVLPERIRQRRANFERYRQYFKTWNERGFNIRFQDEQEGSFSNRWLTCVLVEPSVNKGLTSEDIRLALRAQNIEARPFWKPMHLQPVFKVYPFFGDGTAERLFNIGLCLPSGSNLTDEDFDRIFSSLDKLFKSR